LTVFRIAKDTEVGICVVVHQACVTRKRKLQKLLILDWLFEFYQCIIELKPFIFRACREFRRISPTLNFIVFLCSSTGPKVELETSILLPLIFVV
jgi:hypothetical protein